MSAQAREDSSLLALVRPAPRRVGRYEICFELAAGGMATIYLARSEGPGGFRKLCALKCIHPHLVRQSGFVEMFLDEARLASRIGHPNVCSVFDFGFADATYFIAMEFLVGETVGRLCRLVQQHPEVVPLPGHAAYVARIIADAAQGLHAAHELHGDDGAFLNLVHRDVSPQNVMVTYDGATKVMDFGIARTVDQLHLTRTGTVRGKFPYMAPEQVEQANIDRRADVWSLGVVAWELLTGRRLFEREREVDTIRAVLSAPIAAPSSVRAGVPRDLEDAIMHALERDPARRFGDAHEFAVALENTRGRRDAPASPVALAGWLKQTFPDLHARRLELVDQARQMSESSVPRVSRALSEPALDTRRSNEPAAVVKSDASRSRRRKAVAVGSCLLVLFGGLFVWARKPPAGAAAPVAAGARATPGASATPGANATPPIPRLPVAPPAEPATQPPRAPLAAEAAIGPLGAAVLASAAAPRSHAAVATARTKSGRTQPPAAAAATRDKSAGAQQGHGFVNVATPGGWADVLVAGAHRGRTPLQLELPAGKRTLVLRPFGTGTGAITRRVLVRRDQLTRLVVPVNARAATP